MFQLTYTYKTSNFDFSFTMNHPINNNEIIHYLISNGYFCIAQCPNDLSLLFEEFPFEEIHQTLIQVSNFNFSSSMTKTQLIECLIKNHFPQGISTYSKTQMNQLIVLFNQYSNSICKSRKHCSKLIRNSNELVCNGRGSYIHVNNIQRTCFLNQKTVSKLLTEFNKIIDINKQLDGFQAFSHLKELCFPLRIENQYQLLGLLQIFKPTNIKYSHTLYGYILYSKKDEYPNDFKMID